MVRKSATYEVLLTHGAEQDMESIYDYIAESDCVANADRLLGQLEGALEKLAQLPGRGNHPKELAALGIKEYRQITLKPYRIIYRMVNQQVIIYLIVDGRRDMQSLLARRLLGA